MDEVAAAGALTRLLQLAHAGEQAAAMAYDGHARTVRDTDEQREIRAIRDEELDHRERVGRILAALGAAPDPARERTLRRVGWAIATLCRVGGWYVPMYGAGRLEAGNIEEYAEAARLAIACGRPEFVDDLIDMAEVEWDHEHYFRMKVLSHPLRHVLRVWPEPPPRASIRAEFTKDTVPAPDPAPDPALAAAGATGDARS